MTAGPYSIGSDRWPGLSKLIEEAGEVCQVAGKILGAGGEVKHFDGSDLRLRLEEELGDLIAACYFVLHRCGLDKRSIEARITQKTALFESWHTRDQKLLVASPEPADTDAAVLAVVRKYKEQLLADICESDVPYELANDLTEALQRGQK